MREESWAAWMDAQYAAHAAHAVDPSVLDVSMAGHAAIDPEQPMVRVTLGSAQLSDIQLRGADRRAVDVQQKGVATGRRQLEEIELEREVDRDRVDA